MYLDFVVDIFSINWLISKLHFLRYANYVIRRLMTDTLSKGKCQMSLYHTHDDYIVVEVYIL